ncbi:hypothetical protein [Noviherbaspirillum soli]|uniref:hypothetical protein n=1 Tax=Noviherbaspirillum soli TaxID=1064518 RepID=UPI00188D01FD|nr:hypothetical protein [Noviherbaspirillum soli]
MTHADDDAYLLLIDRHIEELKQRLVALSELIAEMAASDEDTASQSELSCTLVRAIESMEAIKAKEVDALLHDRQQDQAGLPRQVS